MNKFPVWDISNIPLHSTGQAPQLARVTKGDSTYRLCLLTNSSLPGIWFPDGVGFCLCLYLQLHRTAKPCRSFVTLSDGLGV